MKTSQVVFWAVFSVVALLGAYSTLNVLVEHFGGDDSVSGQTFDVSGLEAGTYKRFGTDNGQEIWVYHRIEREIAEVNAMAQYLVDPRSTESQQPSSLRNPFRSADQKYFIFHPISVKSRCLVKFSPASEFAYDEMYTRAPIHEFTHFREPCNGNLFDASGRVVKINNYKDEVNLSVPETKWVSQTQFVVLN